MKIAVGSEETRLSFRQSLQVFLKNPAHRNDLNGVASSKQNRNFRPKGKGRSGRRPLLPKRKLNILVDLRLGKSYHFVVTFLHA